MASLREDKRTGRFYVMFRFGGRQYQRVLPAAKRRAALGGVCRVEETIALIELGRVAIPKDVDPVAFILSDGRLSAGEGDASTTPGLRSRSGQGAVLWRMGKPASNAAYECDAFFRELLPGVDDMSPSRIQTLCKQQPRSQPIRGVTGEQNDRRLVNA